MIISANTETLTEQQTEAPVKKPGFGFWATTGLGILIMVVYFAVTLLMSIGYGIFGAVTGEFPVTVHSMMDAISGGFFLSIVTVATSVVCGLLIFIIVKVRKGTTVSGYLGLGRFTAKAFIVSTLVSIGFIVIVNIISLTINDKTSSSWVDSVYTTSGSLPLLWIAVVLFGPAFEELFFRGFIFEGYRNSRLGVIGTIFITSLIWSVLHLQYNIIGILTIFSYGILFGIIRHKTGSVWITFFLHAMFNLVAMIGTAVTIHGMTG